MENERGPNRNSWMYEDGWRTRGDLTLTGGCTRMVGEREGDMNDARGWLENERRPDINWWMDLTLMVGDEDGWRTKGD